MTPETIKKLEEAFAIDATIEEACFYAGISHQTFYNWKRDHPALFDTIEALRVRPVLAMRQTVIRLGVANYSNAMDYLARKRPEEFGNKTKVELAVQTEDVTSSAATRAITKRYEEEYRKAIVEEGRKKP